MADSARCLRWEVGVALNQLTYHQEERMAPKKPAKGTKTTAKKAKRLSLSKRTLKDLTARGKGPLGGRRMVSDAQGYCPTVDVCSF
jgi:hypothetical protein